MAAVVGGRMGGGAVWVSSLTVDSGSAELGALFVALGEGHGHVHAALRAGAAAAMVERDVEAAPVVVVSDTGRGLIELAADERRALPARVIGITGSTGKTCTKDLAAAILGSRY